MATIDINFSESEKKAYKSFVKKHKKCDGVGAIGGSISYIITPTGLGNIVEVQCNSCGSKKDITDTSNW